MTIRFSKAIPLRKAIWYVTTCKKIKHAIQQCYKIYEFLEDFKFTKVKRYHKGVVVNNAFSVDKESQQAMDSPANVISLSQENVAQLLQLLQKLNQKKKGLMMQLQI